MGIWFSDYEFWDEPLFQPGPVAEAPQMARTVGRGFNSGRKVAPQDQDTSKALARTDLPR